MDMESSTAGEPQEKSAVGDKEREDEMDVEEVESQKDETPSSARQGEASSDRGNKEDTGDVEFDDLENKSSDTETDKNSEVDKPKISGSEGTTNSESMAQDDKAVPETEAVSGEVNASTSKSEVPQGSIVVPIVSPKIPSLVGNSSSATPLTTETSVASSDSASAAAGSENLPRVMNKEMKPTVQPAPLPTSTEGGDSVFKLLAYSKSISSALAAKPSREKRKLQGGGCCNVNCVRGSDDLVIASKSAIIYYHLNTSFKKVYKICSHCLTEAENYIKKATRAAVNGDCILTFKTEPQGMDGDVIEITDHDEEDDPRDVETVQMIDKEVIELTANLDDVISSMLNKIDAKKQVEKCEKAVLSECSVLDRDFVSLDSKLTLVEKQMIEAKKMYDKITGQNQQVPIILEELLIDSKGYIKKSRGDNSHIKNLPPNVQQTIRAVIQRKTNKGEMLPETKPTLGDTQRTRDPDGEIMEVDTQMDTRNVLLPTPKIIPRVVPKLGSVVYAMHKSLLHYWLKGEVTEVIPMGHGKSPEFLIKFEPTRRGKPVRDSSKKDGTTQSQKQVTAKQIAYNVPCPFMLPVGARILAKFRDELKTEPIGDGQYYAGIVAEPPKNTNNFRYLVFFDDGYAQYINHKEVLMVYESSKEVWADVHPDSADFIRNYVQKYPERPMVRLSGGQLVTTEWNGQWWVARVAEVDSSLVKMKFESDGRVEWLYRGSTRLSPLYEKQNRQKTRSTARRHVSTVARAKNQPTIEYNYGDEEGKNKTKMTAKKSTGAPQSTYDKSSGPQNYRLAHYDYGEFEGQIIKKPIPASCSKPRDWVPHKCNSTCAESFNPADKELRKMNPLSVVLQMGWNREQAKNPRKQIFYRTPCGRRLRDLDEVCKFLEDVKCEISIDYFCFDTAVDCLNEFRHSRQHSFLPDLTYGKELTPVQVVNAFDFEYPPYVEYSADRIPGKGVKLNTNDEFLECCDCKDDCRDKSKCACWQLTLKGISFTKLSSPEYQMTGYEYKRLKDHIVSGVYECNSRCSCRKTCFNKVVQNGLKVPLQVFKTAAKGWGIRPLYDIPEGTFICIYAGQVLTEQGANEDGKQFGDEYLAELDYIECNEQIKADYESDATDIEAEDVDDDRKERKKRRGDNSDMNEDGHANDSSYRGKVTGVSERTISTRNKNGKGNGSSEDSKKSSDEDDDDGTRMRSRFNPSGSVETQKYKIKVHERLPLREYFGKDEQCYIMDAKTVGNIGRYLNHSCQPNVFVQNVFVDTHDLRFPWVAFFSSKHIRAGSELTWDYNYDIGSVPDKVMHCYCASPECRGRLL